MKDNRVINVFVEKALSTLGSFDITSSDSHNYKTNYHYVQDNVGKAKFIYGICGYSDDSISSKINNKLEIAAIVSEEMVYIVDRFKVGGYYIELPENAIDFAFELRTKITDFKERIFPTYIDSLPVHEIPQKRENQIKEKARDYVLEGITNPYSIIQFPEIINEQDIVDDLCGRICLEDEILKYLEERREIWIDTKSEIEAIKKYMKSPDILSDWEARLSKSVNNIDAKYLTVEFELNGKKAQGKLAPRMILEKLKDNDLFCDYNFNTTVNGEKLMNELDASRRWNDGKERIFCKHISKITYGRKVIYTKNGE